MYLYNICTWDAKTDEDDMILPSLVWVDVSTDWRVGTNLKANSQAFLSFSSQPASKTSA